MSQLHPKPVPFKSVPAGLEIAPTFPRHQTSADRWTALGLIVASVVLLVFVGGLQTEHGWVKVGLRVASPLCLAAANLLMLRRSGSRALIYLSTSLVLALVLVAYWIKYG